MKFDINWLRSLIANGTSEILDLTGSVVDCKIVSHDTSGLGYRMVFKCGTSYYMVRYSIYKTCLDFDMMAENNGDIECEEVSITEYIERDWIPTAEKNLGMADKEYELSELRKIEQMYYDDH